MKKVRLVMHLSRMNQRMKIIPILKTMKMILRTKKANLTARMPMMEMTKMALKSVLE